ncbi:MAG: DUF4230 domain-containing protein [Oscillospiraceae bacterium]|nr:DUF4230 domain-containing protein [Oscillospiraceae bacterium]
MYRRTVLGIIALLMVAVALVCGIRSYTAYKNELLEKEKEQESVQKAEPAESTEKKVFLKDITLTGETIQSGLRDIGKLCTAEYYFTHVETFESQIDLFGLKIPGTKSSYVYSYDGKILAGVDFTKITVDKDDRCKTILISFPKAEIISTDIDQDSFTLYGEKKGLFNPFEVEDFALSQSDMVRIEEERALNDGLLKRAEENAEQILSNFLVGTFDLERYTITTVFG